MRTCSVKRHCSFQKKSIKKSIKKKPLDSRTPKYPDVRVLKTVEPKSRHRTDRAASQSKSSSIVYRTRAMKSFVLFIVYFCLSAQRSVTALPLLSPVRPRLAWRPRRQSDHRTISGSSGCMGWACTRSVPCISPAAASARHSGWPESVGGDGGTPRVRLLVICH